MFKILLVAFLSVISVTFGDEKPVEQKVRARLEVKEFISDDLPYYHEAKIKYNPGYDPVMHLYDDEGKEIKKVDVAEMSRAAIRMLVENHGLKRSTEKMKEELQAEEEAELPFDENQEYPDEEDEEDSLPPEGEESTDEPPSTEEPLTNESTDKVEL